MLKYLKEEQNKTTTENGCGAYISSESKVLDFFSSAGAMRHNDDEYICTKFALAYNENPLLAMKCLFFVRDIRGGLGERRVFRIAVNWLAKNYPETVKNNFDCFSEYGRYDDLVRLVNTDICDDVIKYLLIILYNDIKCLEKDSINTPSLLAKWMPSENTSSEETRSIARKIIKKMGVSPKVYRKTIASLRRKIGIIENNLREKDYTFDYSKQPSKALLKYRKAFIRNDSERYYKFLSDVESGKAKINTSTLFPVDIVSKCHNNNLTSADIKSLDVTWKNLPDNTTDEDSIVVVDGSGSMYSFMDDCPAYVAQALGIYYAERNKGKFKNHFITFGSSPKLVEIPENLNIVEKVKYISNFCDCSNTNIEKTFDLILDTAVKNNLPQKDLPKRMYIVSDMQFDEAISSYWNEPNTYKTAYSNAKYKFNMAGYEIPEVVFWNVRDGGNVPVTMNEEGVALVSGYTSKLFDMITTNNLNPYKLMLDILESERYNKVVLLK